MSHDMFQPTLTWPVFFIRNLDYSTPFSNFQGFLSVEAASDSDEEPALKQPRLSRRGSPRRQRASKRRDSSCDSRQSASEVSPLP